MRARPGPEPSVLGVVGSAAAALAVRFGLDVAELRRAAPRVFARGDGHGEQGLASEVGDAVATVPRERAPDLLGSLYEGGLATEARRASGVVYTPPGVAEGLVAAAADAIEPSTVRGWRVVDPACGGGAFLLSAARLLAACGVSPGEVVADRVWGVDVDPGAVAVAEASLALWAALEGGHAAAVGDHLAVGDPLVDPAVLLGRPPQGFDLVVGNPPFLGQLAARTRYDRTRRAQLQERWGGVVASYTDSAALFLVVGRQLLAPGGRLALVQPLSVLGARDAREARRAALVDARLHGLWVAPTAVFGAAVRTCAPVIAACRGVGARRVARDGQVKRWVGADVEPVDAAAGGVGLADGEGWSLLALDVLGVPPVTLAVSREAGALVVGDLATATAGFRDEYYGLIPFVCEAPRGADPAAYAPLVTSGLIDPACNGWGVRRTRFAGSSWARPAVDLVALRRDAPALARWVDARRRPKVLVAAQTKVLEVIADPDGVLVPSVPVVSVEPRDPADVALLAAALSAPPITAWAFGECAGTALSADAIKVAARQVLAAPLPARGSPWRDASQSFASGELVRFAASASMAYGLDPDHPVVAWWIDRLPRRTAPR